MYTVADHGRWGFWKASIGCGCRRKRPSRADYDSGRRLVKREGPRSVRGCALAAGQVDLIAGDATAGLIKGLDLFQLEDNRHYFPPYDATAVARAGTLLRYPQVRTALERLSGHVSAADMRAMNSPIITFGISAAWKRQMHRKLTKESSSMRKSLGILGILVIAFAFVFSGLPQPAHARAASPEPQKQKGGATKKVRKGGQGGGQKGGSKPGPSAKGTKAKEKKVQSIKKKAPKKAPKEPKTPKKEGGIKGDK